MKDCDGAGDKFINCTEKLAYSEDEIFNFPSDDGINISRYYHTKWTGILYYLELDIGMIGHRYHSSFKLSLNNNLSYEIAITDPKLHFMSANPATISKVVVMLEKKSKTSKVNLMAIRHEKLNNPANPCEESLDYNAGDCIERSFMKMAGCQPPWRKLNVVGLPLCDNNKKLNKYSSVRLQTWEMTRGELFMKTKCLMPCSFMEYKVKIPKEYHLIKV